MAVFLLFFNLFTIFFLHFVNVMLKKWEPLIKWFFTSFSRFKRCCKMSGVILKCAKMHLNGKTPNIWIDSFLGINGICFSKL